MRLAPDRHGRNRVPSGPNGDCSQAGESMRRFVEMMRGTWREWAHSVVRNDQLYQ
jgi:hypothetical protein